MLLGILSNQVMYLLGFFDFCGFNTGSSFVSNRRKIMNFIILIHISMAIFDTILKTRFIIKLYHSVSIVEVINDMIQYAGALCAYWLIIIESSLLHREHRLFWNIFECNAQYFGTYAMHLRIFLLKIVGYVTVTAALYLSSCTLSDFAYTVLTSAYLALCLMSQIRCFYYIFFIIYFFIFSTQYN